MAHQFKGTCVGNTQSSVGTHVGKLRGENGEEATIPSTDMLLVPGKIYTVSVDGEFAPKPAPAKAAVKYTGPERRKAASSHLPPAGVAERRHAAGAAVAAPVKYSGPERRVKQVAIPAPGVERRKAAK